MAELEPSKHPSFKEPENPEARIWRYLNLAKFLSLLEAEALYFCRIDLLGDPFEGSRPHGENVFWEDILKKDETKKDLVKHNKRVINDTRRMSRQRMYANCWHLNEHEPAAMWHVYSHGTASIALRSTFKRLRDCLPDSIQIGLVKYIDYKTETVPFGNMFNYFLHKRKSFEHERELRALIWTMGMTGWTLDWDVPPEQPGIEIPVELSKLVEQVVIAPEAPDWFSDLVPKIVDRYELGLQVQRSSLSAKPEL